MSWVGFYTLPLVLAFGTISAQPVPEVGAGAGRARQVCTGPLPEPAGLLDREESIRAHGRLPTPCLMALVRDCGDAANEAILGVDEAITCSIRYEALLRHGFGGSFPQLLQWWRSRR